MANEDGNNDDHETFTAKVGTVRWACMKRLDGVMVQRLSIRGPYWEDRNPLDTMGPDNDRLWRVRPAYTMAITLDECLDVLERVAADDGFVDQYWPKAVDDILRRAGRFK